MKQAQRGVVCAMSWVSSDGWEAAGGKSHKALRSSLNCALQAPLSDVPTVLACLACCCLELLFSIYYKGQVSGSAAHPLGLFQAFSEVCFSLLHLAGDRNKEGSQLWHLLPGQAGQRASPHYLCAS